MITVSKNENRLIEIDYNGRKIPFPMIQVGSGSSVIKSYRGNFKVSEKKISWLSLSPSIDGNSVIFTGHDTSVCVDLSEENNFVVLDFRLIKGSGNRFRYLISADPDEYIFGGGEQYSFFNLRGHVFPILTREQGVGRSYKRPLTIISQLQDKSGGAYHTTYYPQPTFVSSKNYFIHVHSFDYTVLDFKASDCHRIVSYSLIPRMTIGCGSSLMDTSSKVSLLLGRQSPLPSWVHDGVILGVQGGTDTVKNKLQKALDSKVKVNALWAQDWSGKIITSFGKRVYWNWKWNPDMYPRLDGWIGELKKKNINFLTYINPYLIKDGSLCVEASEKGYLVKNKEHQDYYIDFGEFSCAHVDLTNPDAFNWYKRKIKENMIDFGLSGWMADFGEYLPVDSVVYSGITGMQAHNMWPGLWAKLNYEVLEETGNSDKIIFFMRSGNSMSPKFAQSIWAGDQNVDWSSGDGIRSVIPAALSLAFSGHGISFSDIGGYTTVLWLKRTKELFIRWLELSCFSPVMRTHEGNRPQSNWQFDSDDFTLSELAYWTDIHFRLKDYIVFSEKENSEKGLAVMRPMNWYCSDKWAMLCTDQYMLGPDLLVAPVLRKNAKGRTVRLPEGEWIHLFSHKKYKEGKYYIPSALSEHSIPVFYRENSSWSQFFSQIV